MTEAETKISPTKAARLVRMSKTTIYDHMKKGKLAYEVTDNGNRLIDASELARVYKGRFRLEDDGSARGKNGGNSNLHPEAFEGVRSERPGDVQGVEKSEMGFVLLQERYKGLEDRCERYEKEIEYFKEQLAKTVDLAAKVTPLLSDQSEGRKKAEEKEREEQTELMRKMSGELRGLNQKIEELEQEREDRKGARWFFRRRKKEIARVKNQGVESRAAI